MIRAQSTLKTLLLVVVFCGCGESEKTSDSQKDTHSSVQLALNWYPEAEHGGYFAADELGLFDDRRLKMEILPGSPGAARNVLQEVAIGRVEFAVSNADQVVEQRARGLPIVALLAPLQQSPRCIMVHESSGITSLQELAGVELSVSDTRPFALWMKHKLPLTNVTIVPFNGMVGEFLVKPNFAQQAYVFSEPFIAKEQGGDPVSLMLSDIGYNPYASVLVTSEQMLKHQPDVVTNVVRASREGWTAYLSDSQATNKRIHRENSDMSLAALEYGVTVLKDLCQTGDGQPTGAMTAARWQELIDLMEELKVIDPDSVVAEDCFRTLSDKP